MLYISVLCEDCAVANEIYYEIDYEWASIHDNGHVITACDVWLQQRIGINVALPFTAIYILAINPPPPDLGTKIALNLPWLQLHW